MPDPTTYESDGTVATIALDDGKVNALSIPTLQALHAALDQAEAEGAAIVLTGREGLFSAGYDLKGFAAGGATLVEMLTLGATLSDRLLVFPRPVVVACTGNAIAAGTFPLLAADVALVADGAFRLGLNETRIGLTLPRFAVELARQGLAPQALGRAVIQAELFDPAGAVLAGYADRVVAADVLLTEAQAIAAELATACNPEAFAGTKWRVREPALDRYRAALALDQKDWQGFLG